MLERRGYHLVKSKHRDPRAIDYGTYMIIHTATNTVEAGGHPGFGLDDVDAWLNDDHVVALKLQGKRRGAKR
jgi:hypothetical protein